MKKKILIIIATVMTVCILATMFAGCSQSEEEFFTEIKDGVEEFNTKYVDILANLKEAQFSAEFSIERHFNAAMDRGTTKSKGWDQFEQAYNKLYDSYAPDNNFIEDLFGNKSEEQEAIDALGMESNGWYDQYATVKYYQNNSGDFYIEMTVYAPVWENFYEDFRAALEDSEKLAELETSAAESDADKYRYDTIKATIDGVTVTEVRTKDGATVMSINGETASVGLIADGIELLEQYGVHDAEFSSDDLVGFSDGNKIYTHVMQAQYRTVYGLPETTPEFYVPTVPTTSDPAAVQEYLSALDEELWIWQSELNAYFDPSLRVGAEENAALADANASIDDETMPIKGYWTGYNEDISYDWNKIGAMYTARYTYDYNNKHKRLEQIDFYTERIMPYYTEKNAIDATLELKADVFDNTHLVIDFVYPEEGEEFAVPNID